jgi:prophage regulatory protein
MVKTGKGHLVGDTGPVQRIYRRTQLPSVTGYSIPYLYELIEQGRFPRPIPLGARAVGWLESDISRWQQERIAARGGKVAA